MSTELDEARHALAGTLYAECIDDSGHGIYFSYGFEEFENPAKEGFTQMCSIQEELRACGYEILDPYVEHDCISGYLVKLPT
jgi:hypothetical protein